ncbi:hypothetical protein GTP41_25755 [Pseudoduganella sp. DS3]|uniref:DUF4184 family protein n=1 Tax=Pseudoduganella guangdongensis TaxID=2692179 RepID=A0A6N9HPU4_9BURK|nr:hypothetical protein [Pseudoduganella guangdongensis]MYN05504.1 hypothetical protein [Pseudoduganella guangdongensis]
MPITPFHFGPGAAIHALAPQRISFLGFCAANVLIDVESLYYLSTHQYPVHRFFHTYIGATLVAILAVMLFLAARSFARRFWLPNLFGWQALSISFVAAGAVLGTYTHIVFDSIMHSDMLPFAPFSGANPLLRIVSLPALHWFCVASGVLGLTILFFKKR